MTGTVYLEDGRGVRELGEDDFPLALGSKADGSRGAADEPRAYLGLEGGEVFVQPVVGPLICNGQTLHRSQWLRDGDRIDIGGAELEVETASDGLHLRIRSLLVERATESVSAAPEMEERAAEQWITPVTFEPSRFARGSRRGALPWLGGLAALLLFTVAAAGGWYLMTARSVEVTVVPEPEILELEGGLAPRLGGRFLLRHGEYQLTAERAGYRPLATSLEVSPDSPSSFSFELEPLPSRLRVLVEPAEAPARVLIDGSDHGPPTEDFELPPGQYQVSVAAPGFELFEERVAIENPGSLLELRAPLVDNRAQVTFRARQPGVEVAVAGRRRGAVPTTVAVEAGRHPVDWLRVGFKPARTEIEVVRGIDQLVEGPELVPADGNLLVTSIPDAVAVSVDGVFKGSTPLDLELSPGGPYQVSLSKSGYQAAVREVRVAPGNVERLEVELEEETVELKVTTRPVGAEVWVDGELRGATELGGPLAVILAAAGEHLVEARKEGYLTASRSVVARPGLGQSLEFVLLTPAEDQARRTPPRIQTDDGHALSLIPGGRFQMGAGRREPGRRPNETQREVELTRSFYIGMHEVTNEQYRKFDLGHLSGTAGSNTLDLADQPVVQVSWAAAARYCNWLSAKEDLPPAYELRDGELKPVVPMNTGYRLPTEAEWAWVARYPEAPTVRKYSWGDSLPLPPQAGNFGDRSAGALLAKLLPDYDDGHPATAAVATFEPNPLGIYHLGGNVAEWMSDRYAVDPRDGQSLERDPFGPGRDTEGQHVIRGASWTTHTLTELRLSYRDSGSEGQHDVGFRIARYAE